MINIILISHGSFCEGLLDSLKMIAGSDFGIQTVPLQPGTTPESYRDELEKALAINREKEDKRSFILSDIAGGTPYQSAIYLAKDFEIGLLSGMNMPMLLSLVLEYEENSTIEYLVKKHCESGNCGIGGLDFKKGVAKKRAKLSINKN